MPVDTETGEVLSPSRKLSLVERVDMSEGGFVTGQPVQALIPRTFTAVLDLAKMIHMAKFCPPDDTPEAITIKIMHGLEVGLPPMAAIQNIAVINGRPTIWGDAALALVIANPICAAVNEWAEGVGDNLTFYCESIRKGDERQKPKVGSFSVAQAKHAGLWDERAEVFKRDGTTYPNPSPWYRFRERMMQMRARGFSLRDAFPDVLKGLALREEIDPRESDFERADAAPVINQRPAPKTDIGSRLAEGRERAKNAPAGNVATGIDKETAEAQTTMGRWLGLCTKAKDMVELETYRDEYAGWIGALTGDAEKQAADAYNGAQFRIEEDEKERERKLTAEREAAAAKKRSENDEKTRIKRAEEAAAKTADAPGKTAQEPGGGLPAKGEGSGVGVNATVEHARKDGEGNAQAPRSNVPDGSPNAGDAHGKPDSAADLIALGTWDERTKKFFANVQKAFGLRNTREDLRYEYDGLRETLKNKPPEAVEIFELLYKEHVARVRRLEAERVRDETRD